LRLKKRKGAKILRKERKDLLFFDAICHTPGARSFRKVRKGLKVLS